MVRRYRCLVVVACLTAFVVTLGLPWIGLSICGVGTDATRLDAPEVRPERVGDRPEHSPSVVARQAAATRGPPYS